MLFLYLEKDKDSYENIDKLYEILEKNDNLYEEFILSKIMENNFTFDTFIDKKIFREKEGLIKSLINTNWMTYPHYIFRTLNFFKKDDFMISYSKKLDKMIKPDTFYLYLIKLFEKFNVFDNCDKEELDKSLKFLS